jgi:N-acetylmuramoyl-L-alanine amidase
MDIANHRLLLSNGKPCRFLESPNQGGQVTPEYLVYHFTGGETAASSIAWLRNPTAQASAHLVIARDGAITQLVPFDRVAWHAGKSSWRDRTGLNAWSLGIELDNAGALTRRGNQWVAWFGTVIPTTQVLEAVHRNETALRGWHRYTTAQLELSVEVGAVLMRTYGLKEAVGHDDIAPGRKIDPGPAFPMVSVQARLMGRADTGTDTVTTTATVNLRVGPGTANPTAAGSPLPKGTAVQVLQSDGLWRFVDVLQEVNGVSDAQGWVHGKFLAGP